MKIKRRRDYKTGIIAGEIAGLISFPLQGILGLVTVILFHTQKYTSLTVVLYLIVIPVGGVLLWSPFFGALYVFLYERLPTKAPIIKSLILVMTIWLLTEIPVVPFDPSDLTYTLVTLPIYPLFALILSFSYERLFRGKANLSVPKLSQS